MADEAAIDGDAHGLAARAVAARRLTYVGGRDDVCLQHGKHERVERRVDGADDLAEGGVLGGGPPATRRARQAEEETVGRGVGDDARTFAEKEELDECALPEVARANVRQLEDRAAGVRDG